MVRIELLHVAFPDKTLPFPPTPARVCPVKKNLECFVTLCPLFLFLASTNLFWGESCSCFQWESFIQHFLLNRIIHTNSKRPRPTSPLSKRGKIFWAPCAKKSSKCLPCARQNDQSTYRGWFLQVLENVGLLEYMYLEKSWNFLQNPGPFVCRQNDTVHWNMH